MNLPLPTEDASDSVAIDAWVYPIGEWFVQIPEKSKRLSDKKSGTGSLRESDRETLLKSFKFHGQLSVEYARRDNAGLCRKS